MAKCSTDTCCLTLPLRLEKWQEDRLAKRFEIARQIYNTMVRAELKKLQAIEQSEPYKANQEKIQALDWKTQADKQALKALYKERDKLLRDGGFSEYGFKSDIKNYYKHFNNNIGSTGSHLKFGLHLKKCFSKKKEKKSTSRKKGTYIPCADILQPEKAAALRLFSEKHILNGKGSNCR